MEIFMWPLWRKRRDRRPDTGPDSHGDSWARLADAYGVTGSACSAVSFRVQGLITSRVGPFWAWSLDGLLAVGVGFAGPRGSFRVSQARVAAGHAAQDDPTRCGLQVKLLVIRSWILALFRKKSCSVCFCWILVVLRRASIIRDMCWPLKLLCRCVSFSMYAEAVMVPG